MLYAMVECMASQCHYTCMHGQVKDVVVACLVHRSRISNSPTEDRYFKKKVEGSIMSYAYECILHVISAYFHRPAIHIDYQITCNVYKCIMIFLFVSHQRFNFGHLSLSYQPHILTEIPISRAGMIICYALNSFILDVTLFWILCIRTEYKMSANM